jgi:uncharacterized protein
MIWILALLALYVGLLLAISWFSLHPFRVPIFLSPGALGTPQENVELETDDGVTLRGWWVEHPEPRAVVVLVHGYMMNRAELAAFAQDLWSWGCACLLFDTRAHGRSGGKMCGLGFLEREDVRAATAFARGKAPGAKVVLLGSSMGGAACAFALADDPDLADLAILDSAYSRLPWGIVGWWRFLGGKPLAALLAPSLLVAWPLARFNPWKVDVAEALRKSKGMPMLLLHGDCDNLALPAEAERNLAALDGRGSLVWLADCGHGEGRWVHPEPYREAVRAFLLANEIELVTPTKKASGS